MSRQIGRVLVRGVAPTVLIVLVAVVLGMARTVGLGMFLAAAGARLAFDALDGLGHHIPRPHWNPARPRPIPAPEVTPA